MAITDEVCADAASIGTGELSRGIARGKGAAEFIAVVLTVIGVVAHIVKWHTAAIVTGEVHGRAGVEGLARGTTWYLLIFVLKDRLQTVNKGKQT